MGKARGKDPVCLVDQREAFQMGRAGEQAQGCVGLVRPRHLPVGLQRRVGAEGRGRRPDEGGGQLGLHCIAKRQLLCGACGFENRVRTSCGCFFRVLSPYPRALSYIVTVGEKGAEPCSDQGLRGPRAWPPASFPNLDKACDHFLGPSQAFPGDSPEGVSLSISSASS